MASNINLFKQPQLLPCIKSTISNLKAQVAFVESLIHAQHRLNTVTPLSTKDLDKCNVFAKAVNQAGNIVLDKKEIATEDSVDKVPEKAVMGFIREVSLLLPNEFAFASTCFTHRSMQTVIPVFTASKIRDFVDSQQIVCGSRREIIIRLSNAKPENGKFRELMLSKFPHSKIQRSVPQKRRFEPDGLEAVPEAVSAPSQLHTGYADTEKWRTPDVNTLAEKKDTFLYPTALCKNLEECFGGKVASKVDPGNGVATEGVRGRYPRIPGDAFIYIDLASEDTWLCRLFPGKGTGMDMEAFKELFGPEIVEAVSNSDFRRRETSMGMEDVTDCVQLAYTLKVRVSSRQNSIPDKLFST